MNTTNWSVDKNVDKNKSYPQVTEAADLLINNEVVAFPTETVYGLGGNAKSDIAVSKIFAAKGRPSDNPLIIHIADISQLDAFVQEIPKKARQLMKAFWPGALTLILKIKPGYLSETATAGLHTVAVRIPDHPVALALLKKCQLPVAAPSANSSGKPSPTTAEHVAEDLTGKIAGILDGGATGVGLESTVLDCTVEIPTILRPGGITKVELEAVIGDVMVDPAILHLTAKPKSPGMKYAHYAPNMPLFLVNGDRDKIQKLVTEKQAEGQKVGVLTTEENSQFYTADFIYVCGTRNNLNTVASALYDGLRAFNHADVSVIFSEMFPNQGVGEAIMNRLQKAAANQII